jgi:DNA-binding LacI/PurR family transcriptional regulator
VFNRPDIVKADVRERVEAAARRLGYAGPDPKGRLLRAGKVNAIGVITGDATADVFTDPYLRELMAGIAEVCDAHGAGVSIVSARRQTKSGWRVQSALVDGFIVSCLRVGADLVALARERQLPFVSVDLDAGPATRSVLVDDRQGGYLAARHLLELGHRRIAIVGMGMSAEPAAALSVERVRLAESHFEQDRMAGYGAALAEHGLALEAMPYVEVPYCDTAADEVAALLAEHPDVTAVLAISDVLAFTVYAAARARGLHVPQDLSVVGFDDVPEAALSTPPLTTVAQPIREKGRLAAQLILAPGETTRPALLPVNLVVRGSTAAPRR